MAFLFMRERRCRLGDIAFLFGNDPLVIRQKAASLLFKIIQNTPHTKRNCGHHDVVKQNGAFRC